MFRPKWKVLSRYSLGLPLYTEILKQRGINDVEAFIHPGNPINSIKQFFAKDFFEEVKKTKTLIDKFVSEGKSIVVFGDYDADGICATSILYSFLRFELNYKKITYFIPNRFDHGYGLSKGAVDKALLGIDGAALIITVDTGITAVTESTYLKSLGHSLIITDHHQKLPTLPSADAVVWSDKVVGSTIAWVITKLLGSKVTKSVSLAALATVTDLQPLVGFNRELVSYGLKIINQDPYPGLVKLMEAAGRKDVEINTYDFGFVIGPRLNASGRLEDAGKAVEIFLQDDPNKLKAIAQTLNDINNKRQDITLEMFELASISKDQLPNVIVSSNPDYHEGIIGLVAAKLVQRYYRPSIVISLSEDFGKGSARSIPGINIIELLREFSEMFTNLGGHPMAAGFTIHSDKITDFTNAINSRVSELYGSSIFEPIIEIDMEIPINILSVKEIDLLDRLKPYGVGNKEPLLLTRNLKIHDIKTVGKDNSHLSLKLSDGVGGYKAIMFGGGELLSNFGLGDYVDIVYNAKINEFNDNRSVNLTLLDMRRADEA